MIHPDPKSFSDRAPSSGQLLAVLALMAGAAFLGVLLSRQRMPARKTRLGRGRIDRHGFVVPDRAPDDPGTGGWGFETGLV